MRIISLRPVGRGTTLAYLDLEVDGLRLFDIELRRASDGTLRAWAPQRGGRAVGAISVDLAKQVTQAAVAAMEGGSLVQS